MLSNKNIWHLARPDRITRDRKIDARSQADPHIRAPADQH